jgi:cell division septation protein DedD
MARRVAIHLALFVVIVGLSRSGYAQQPPSSSEIQIETALVEVDADQLKVVRLRDNGDPPVDAQTASFSLAVPESLAKSLARSPGAKILQSPVVQASLGKNTGIYVNTHVPSENALPMEAGIDIDVQPRIGANGDVSMSANVRLWVTSGAPPETVFSSRAVRQNIELSAGLTSILGGFITREEASALTQMKALKAVPMLSSFFSERNGHRDREMIIMLTPRVPELPKIAVPEPETLVSKVEPVAETRPIPEIDRPQVVAAPPAPIQSAPPVVVAPPVQPVAPPAEVKPYSVQVGAFSNQAAANGLKRELETRYPDVFIEPLTSVRVLYRVRVGHFRGVQSARQVETQLKADGLDTTIVRLDGK